MTDLNEGTLLVATSKLKDATFIKSVILIIKTNEEFKLGVILNRTLNKIIKLKDIKTLDKYLKYGGPVPGPVVAIHHDKELAENTVKENIFYSCGFENINKIINTQLYQFYSGYCTWKKGQLEKEVADGYWSVMSLEDKKIIYEEDDFIWIHLRHNYSKSSFKKMGIDISKFNYLLN